MNKNNLMQKYLLDNLFKTAVHDIGNGIIYAVPYDTAWLARIPAKENLTKLAYPDAIVWLLKNQHLNGTWGNIQPFNLCDTLLNTLAAILALAEWGSQKYSQQITNAVNGLATLLEQHPLDAYETIAFEMLYPSLIQQCEQQQLIVPENLLQFNATLQPKYLYKKNLIEQAEMNSKTFSRQPWWFSAELLGDPKQLTKYSAYYQKMISKEGSVAASPAATAYVVAALRYQGIEVPHAVEYLEKIMKSPHSFNSAPNVAPIDEFETAFSANYLFEAGADKHHPLLKKLVAQARKHWLARNKGGMGYSTHFFIDPDGTANAMMTLNYGGFSDLTVDVLLEKFNGEFTETFTAERISSISSNLHVLQASQLFKNNIKVKEIINKLLTWLNEQAYSDPNYPNFTFTDKWHISPIYPTARAVLALINLDPALAQSCINDLIKNQHADGGFGAFENSTMEETAFAMLALCHWQKNKMNIDQDILIRAQKFLMEHEVFDKTPLWIGKVLYCPRLVVASIITAAKIAIIDCLEQSTDKYLVETDIQTNLNFDFPALTTSYHSNLSVKLFENYCEWIRSMNLPVKKSLLTPELINACINAMRTENLNALEIFSEYSLLVLLLDDILDENWQQFETIKPLLNFIISIMINGKIDKNNIPDEIKTIGLAYQNIYERTKAINPNINEFVKSIKNQFDSLEQEFLLRKQNRLPALEDYLKLRAIIGGMDTSAELGYLLNNISLSNEIRNNPKFQSMRDCSYKAIILLNDLVSYQKEINEKYKGDNFVFLYQAQYATNLSEAIQQCRLAYVSEINNFLADKNLVLQNYINEINHRKSAEAASLLLAGQVQANLDWVRNAQRYHRPG